MAKPYLNPEYFSTYSEFIPNFDKFCEVQSTLPPVVIRRNKLKCSRPAFESFLKRHVDNGAFKAYRPVSYVEECYEIDAAKAIVGGLLEHHVGLFYIMGASSILPVMALDPKPGEHVLDMSAAPGGKTCLIAQMMNDQGLLVSNEPSHLRRRVLKANLDRMGVSNTFVTSFLGEAFPTSQMFDRILLDGPCSAEGSLRGGWSKSFDYKRNDEYRAGLQRLQLKLLKRSSQLLKTGGRLVYSTCTYDPCENEAQVHAVLNEDKSLSIIDSKLEGPWLPGVTSWQGKDFNQQVCKTFRILPHLYNSWGFFVATFIKQ
tara:strand:+ start:24390 stop:25334 length:945 start_codon:yes stop_codon:yes gene_type:complete